MHQKLKLNQISLNILRCSTIQNAGMVSMVSILHSIMKSPIKRWLDVSRVLLTIQFASHYR